MMRTSARPPLEQGNLSTNILCQGNLSFWKNNYNSKLKTIIEIRIKNPSCGVSHDAS